MTLSYRYNWLVAIVSMLAVVIIGDMGLLILNGHANPELYAALSLFYILPYLWILFRERLLPSLNAVVVAFLFIKIYMILHLNIFSDIESAGLGGDAESYHIPRALSLDSSYFEYLFSLGGDYNGRLTHVLLSLYISILKQFDVTISYGSIHNVAYFFNTALCVLTLFLYQRIVKVHTSSEPQSRRALWFLAFNPLFISVTALPQKEALLFFGLALFSLCLVSKKRSTPLLLMSLFIISMERIYMTPLLILIMMFFDGRVTMKSAVIVVMGGLFVEVFIGVEAAKYMLDAHSESLMETGHSYLGGFGIISNITRAYFGPFALRNFIDGESVFGVLLSAHYLLILFYPYIAVRASLQRVDFGMAILLTLLFVAILIPYHSSFKLFMIVFFGGLFISSIIQSRMNNFSNLKVQGRSKSLCPYG